MNEEAKSRVAQFRFGVIHDLIGDRKLERGERKRLLKEKSSCAWEIPYSERSFISVDDPGLVGRYEKGGRRLESHPEARKTGADRGSSTRRRFSGGARSSSGAPCPSSSESARLRKIQSGDQGSSGHDLPPVPGTGLMNRQEVAEDRRRFEAECPTTSGSPTACTAPRSWWKERLAKPICLPLSTI